MRSIQLSLLSTTAHMYNKRPKVLIVRAGLGGLTLGTLLHKANIPYKIYERASEVKPIGSAMYFHGTTANLFKQCGIYNEFVSSGKFVSAVNVCNEQREIQYKIDFQANGYIISRPKIYDLLSRQVPRESIHFGKKILSMENGGNGVLVRFSDGTEAEGDILVGADGAYMRYDRVSMQVNRHGYYSTVAWGSILFLDEETSKNNDAFRNSEWGPEAAAAMCEKIKDFPVTSGGDRILTFQDLMDRTPKN
ncbi:hypothetical protein KI688_005871 [Linnemannia hyalina]|uniref:FAD-binding domain-containing protein n=1 Tax=Linnemannia hyalina TaxID=64524 RepID=A0A9P7Y3M5_9FUNG|nr:hypothetical protein KI688_005871 [Linnemannia hyalina]